MILSTNSDALEYRGIHPNLDLALEHISPEFFRTLGDERVELKGSEVYCTRFSYETVSDEGAFFEAHEKYLDIHIMLLGDERVELAPPKTLRTLEAKPENDFWAYQGTARHSLILSPDNFLVVFPEDAHKIKLCVTQPQRVTKAVFKVKIR